MTSRGPTEVIRKTGTGLALVSKVQAEATSRIFTIHGFLVVLDSDLAEFYGVETERLVKQVDRNQDRFPADFAFRLTPEEFRALIQQNVGTKPGRGGRRKLPLVFTEQGALTAAGVLRSDRAAEASVAIARAFVAMRDRLLVLEDHPILKALARRVGQLESGSKEQEEFNRVLMKALRELHPILEAVERDPSPTEK